MTYFVIVNKQKSSGEVSHSSDWVLDEAELTSKFTARTKAIIVNTPNNPLGKVFTQKELEFIGQLCIKWDVLCIMDEVYEWLVYEPYRHFRMGDFSFCHKKNHKVLNLFFLVYLASLPEMWDRTLTICSAGKTFSVTGWKLGWAYGPAPMMRNLFVAHQNALYTCVTPTQVNSFKTKDTKNSFNKLSSSDRKPWHGKKKLILCDNQEYCLQSNIFFTFISAEYFIIVAWKSS